MSFWTVSVRTLPTNEISQVASYAQLTLQLDALSFFFFKKLPKTNVDLVENIEAMYSGLAWGGFHSCLSGVIFTNS